DQETIAVYYDADVGVYYPAHNIVVLYWFAGGIFMVAALALMTGSAFNRHLHQRRRRPKGRDRSMRDTVLAGCVVVLFFSLQSPELVDRWLWLPFMLALCFRDAVSIGAAGAVAAAEDALVPPAPEDPSSEVVGTDSGREAVAARTPATSAPPMPPAPSAQAPGRRRDSATVRRASLPRQPEPPFQPAIDPPPAS
ncbi:MAG TPA: hypothetical protein VHD39_03455, partial [Acidimicrobiales bacterium]|nr:hypothetical protein [Acidimicrobiales bacterium]